MWLFHFYPQIKYDVVITKIEGRCIISRPELNKCPISPQCENKEQTSIEGIYTSHMYSALFTKYSLTFQTDTKIIRLQKILVNCSSLQGFLQ